MSQSANRSGVVAAGHPLTAAAGAEILRQGGNAFDAAIAAVMTAWVTESVLTSAGGGGFLLAHTQSGKNRLFDFFTQTPKNNRLSIKPDFYPIHANFGDTVQEFHIGLGSIAVPGMVAGLLHVHQQLGRLPLTTISQPAIKQAQQGVTVSPFLAYLFDLLTPILTATPAAQTLYTTQNGRVLQTGDTLQMPELADMLQLIAEQGATAFYRGAIAHQIVHDCQTLGGYLTLEDFQQYQVIEREPLSVQYRDTVLLTNPPPSSGGMLIAFALELLESLDLSQLAHGGDEHLSCLAQVMAITNGARRQRLDHAIMDDRITQKFLSSECLSTYRQLLADRINRLGSTTHVSVIDAEGNAASVTTSNGEGSSYVVPQTGIMMNNMLGEEDLHPQGFHQWQPDQRISSMMAPTMILREGKPYIVLGSGGSNRIRTAILQVISNVVDFHLPLAAAIEAPRIHWERGTLQGEPQETGSVETLLPLPDTKAAIAWGQPNLYFGGVHAVGIGGYGTFQGAGDPRRGGAVAIA